MNNVMEEKIIFTTGGTGGHIYPALAIAKEFKKKRSIDSICWDKT